jgi:transposase InsO family protein
MSHIIAALSRTLISALSSHRKLTLENLALRHQIGILQRGIKHPHLKKRDRLLWVLLSRIWKDWASSLILVKPDTVVRWHRKGFRLYWARKSRQKRKGRPAITPEIRELVRKMSRANPLWGAPRVHGELLKLGFEISQATVSKYMLRRRDLPSQTWKTFLDNHIGNLASVDFFTVPTVTFRVLFVFVVLTHDRRRVVHFNVTDSPTTKWTAQQIVEAFPWDSAPQYLIRDRDGVYRTAFSDRVQSLGIREVKTAPRSPWQNPYAERLIGTLRRDCIDHVIVLSENHLRHLLRRYLVYYHTCRTHLSLQKDSPEPRQVQLPKFGKIIETPLVGGLHHRYDRLAD